MNVYEEELKGKLDVWHGMIIFLFSVIYWRDKFPMNSLHSRCIGPRVKNASAYSNLNIVVPWHNCNFRVRWACLAERSRAKCSSQLPFSNNIHIPRKADAQFAAQIHWKSQVWEWFFFQKKCYDTRGFVYLCKPRKAPSIWCPKIWLFGAPKFGYVRQVFANLCPKFGYLRSDLGKFSKTGFSRRRLIIMWYMNFSTIEGAELRRGLHV